MESAALIEKREVVGRLKETRDFCVKSGSQVLVEACDDALRLYRQAINSHVNEEKSNMSAGREAAIEALRVWFVEHDVAVDDVKCQSAQDHNDWHYVGIPRIVDVVREAGAGLGDDEDAKFTSDKLATISRALKSIGESQLAHRIDVDRLLT